MSGSNGVPQDLITLDELERLIKLLGMLSSSADGEVLNAAKLAQRWVVAKGTDWRTLLTPEPEAAVTGVAVAGTGADTIAREEAAYRTGYQAGVDAERDAQRAQKAAQAAQAQAAVQAARAAAAAQAAAGGLVTGVSWQDVAQGLLNRSAQGIPGVFRGSREQQFVSDVLTRGFPTLTPAQEVWLRDIAGRSGMSW